MKLLKKAYEINRDKFAAPWDITDEVFYAETRGKAKNAAWMAMSYDGTYYDKYGREITFLNLPIRRAKDNDIYEYLGKEKRKCDIDYDIQKNNRNFELDKLLSENPDGKCYIIKRGQYYRPNSNGYTDHRIKAGIYSLEEGISDVKRCGLYDNIHVQLIDIEEHNKYMIEHIEDLKSRLL